MDPATAAMLLASSDADMKSDLAAGIVTPDMAANINSAMVNKIVGSLATGFVGSDPAKGLALVRTLQLQDEVNAGTMTAEEAAALSGLDASSAYTLSVLRLATPEVATKAITEAIKNANTIDSALDEFVAEGKAAVTAQNGDLFNSAFGVSVTAPASVDLTARLQAVAPEALALAGIDPTQPITGKQYIDLATRLLDTRNSLTPEQRKSLDTHKNPDTVGPFAAETNAGVYATLVEKGNTGNLTQDALSAAKGDLTLKDWETLTAKIQSEADESFKAIDDQVAAQFKYNKIAGATDAASKEAEAAYAFVSSRLLAETIRRKSEGDPMTRIEVNAFAKSLVDERMVTYREALKVQLQEYLEKQRSNGIPSLTPGLEIVELDAWYNGLAEPTDSQRSKYFGVRGTIVNMMGN
jgi:hypothetical protein